jgi:hypothetical protein
MPDTLLPKLLDEKQAATVLNLRPNTLAIWRATKRYDLPYVKCGRFVRYRESDLLAWLDSRTIGRPVEVES